MHVEHVRIAVIGVNGIGQAHLFAIAAAERSELVAVCDIDALRAEKTAANAGVAAFTSVEDLCSAGVADAAVIATPCGTHGPIARATLDAGLHVYCEKPITPTADEGYALARYAAEAKRVLAVGFQYRFHTGYAAARRAVDEIAPLAHVQLEATNWFRPQAYFDASPWRSTWTMAGGGVLMNQAVHQLDTLISITGMPSRVHARVSSVRHRAAVEDHAVALLEWSSGATGGLVASLNEPAGRERFTFAGAKGSVVLTDGYLVKHATHDDVQKFSDECPDEFPELTHEWKHADVARASSEWLDMFVDAHRDFASAVLDGSSPVVPAVDGTRAVELANAIYLSSCTGETVDIPLERGDYPRLFDELVSGSREI
jgi:predicted dehydrogenase